MLKFTVMLKHRDELLSEACSWHHINGSLTTQNVKAYTAGYEQGFRDALATLKLHGGVDIDYNA